MSAVKNCNICKRALDDVGDRRTTDCGGDCAQCMAEAGDPEFEHLRNNGRAPEEIWTTEDGRKIPVGEMEEAHVRDTLRMLIRGINLRAGKRKLRLAVLKQLEKELADALGEDKKWGSS